ncbi:hypothetical protein JMJ35_002642 [Cladonia borealis]|uniref:Uncharacterized protein n=1 Tax=Cladonia borealis TaxID=184061 RepID=A0AA39V408_9LECA|nr:hypothetical protein JMJ35_002642 [Cladonia borealis]
MPLPRSLRPILLNCAIATAFGAALWLRQRSTNATNTVRSQKLHAFYGQIVEKHIKPYLRKTFQDNLGCQNVRYTPSEALASRFAPEDDVAKVAGIQVGLFLDADAAGESLMGSVIGFGLTSTGKEEIELVTLAQEILKDWDRQGLLRRKGRAVLLVSCKGVDGIWVYGEEGVEVEGAIDKMELEGGWMSQLLSFKRENLPFCLVMGLTQS